MTRDVGIVGLGLVGLALARRLASSGRSVRGFDIAPAQREALRASGAKAVDAVQEALACATVIIAVYDDAQVGEVLAHALRPGTTIVDCVTGVPAFATAAAMRLAAGGVGYVDVPLVGSSTQIANGEALALAGGDDAALASQAALLAAIARSVTHFGPAGAGRAAKLATNLILGLNRAAFAEGLAFAEQMGLDPRRFSDFVSASPAGSAAARSKSARMLARDYVPESRVRQHRKDLALIVDAAQRCGAALVLAPAHAALLDAAIDEGLGDLDNAAVIEHYRRGVHAPRT